MIEHLLVPLISAAMKVLAAWCAWHLAMWFHLPEWGTICLIVMAVQSTFITVRRT